MLSQRFVPDAALNKLSSHANVPLSSLVTLKMVRVTFSEGIQLRLNLWSNGLLIRGCPPPVGGTKPMVSPFRFKDKVIKNKPDDRLKFQLRGRLLLLKAALWCLTHNEPSYDLISLQLVEAQTKWRLYHLKNRTTFSVILSTCCRNKASYDLLLFFCWNSPRWIITVTEDETRLASQLISTPSLPTDTMKGLSQFGILIKGINITQS